MITIHLTGWQGGLRKVSLCRTITAYSALSITQAKEKVDQLLAGQIVEIELPTQTEATGFCRAAMLLEAHYSVADRASRQHRT